MWSRWNYNNIIGRGSHPDVVAVVAVVAVAVVGGIGIVIERAGISGGSECGAGITNTIQSCVSVNGARRRVGEEARYVYCTGRRL
jgi:hypothetical protein